jgi:hypothetical protein
LFSLQQLQCWEAEILSVIAPAALFRFVAGHLRRLRLHYGLVAEFSEYRCCRHSHAGVYAFDVPGDPRDVDRTREIFTEILGSDGCFTVESR